MAISLDQILALSGPLSDQPGADTGRERFRRVLTSSSITVADLRELIADAQRSPGDQSQRALGDLVLTLGRLLGFDVVYGTYERARAGVRFDGVWRSPGRVRIALEIRTDRTRPFDPADLARTIAALPTDPADVSVVPTLGLCVVVPAHGSRRRTDAAGEASARPDVRVLPLSGLLSPAVLVESGRLTHAQVVNVFVGGESPLAESPDSPVEDVDAALPPSPHLSLVRREDPPDYWIATIVSDEGATSEQVVGAVIRGRQLLPVSPFGIFPASARTGDRVCFYVSGHGVMGFGQFGVEIHRTTAPIRGADRFAAIFTLTDLSFFDAPMPLDPASPAQRLATRAPLDTPGSFLSPIAEHDFRTLTARVSSRPGGELNLVR